MNKQQHILTLIIILAVLALVILVGSIIYDEKIKENKKAIEEISVPEVVEKKEEVIENIEKENQSQKNEEYIGEEEKKSEEQEVREELEQTDEERAINLAKEEWGEDNSVLYSIEEKKDTKIYVAVKQDAIVIQWYEIDTTDWTIKEY